MSKAGFLAQSQKILPFIMTLLFAGYAIAAEHKGRVVFNGLGVPGAVVTASRDDLRITTSTDANGMYSFLDVLEGSWKVRVEMQAFSSMLQEIIIGYSATPMIWELKLLPIEQIQGVIMPSAPARTQSPPDAHPASKEADNAGLKESTTLASTISYQRAELAATGALDPAKSDADEGITFQLNSPFSGLQKDDLDLRAADGMCANRSVNDDTILRDWMRAGARLVKKG